MNRHTGPDSGRPDGAVPLSDSGRRYRDLLSASNQVFYRHNADWSEMRQLAGGGFLADTDKPDPNWFDKYIHPDDQAEVWSRIQEAVRTRSTFEFEHRVIREDGTLGWTLSRSIPIFDEHGEIVEWFGAASDVSARHEAEDALRESQAHLAALVNQAAAGVAETDLEGRFINVNDRFCAIVGRSRGDLLGTTIQEITHPDDVPNNLALFRRTVESGQPFDIEKRYVKPDGSLVWVNNTVSLIRSADGEAASVVAVSVDITERKRTESLRAEQNRVLELAIEDRPLGDILEALVRSVEDHSATNVLGSILLLDESGKRLRHGAAPNLPPAYNETIDGLEIGPAAGSCGTAAHSKEPVFVSDIAVDPLWKDFRDLALAHGLKACWSIPIVNGAGEVLGTFAMYYPEPREPTPADLELVEFVARSAAIVIERNRSELALREGEARFREVANAAPVLIWLADTDNQGIWYNKAWLEFTGRTMEQDLGDGWLEAVHPDDRARCAEICGGAFERRKPFRLDFRLRRHDGEWRVIDDSGVPRFAEDGTFLGYIGSCTDVTDARTSEQALREQAAELQTILDAVPAAIWVARDSACSDIGGNSRARQLLKMSDGAQMSKSATDAPSHFRIFGPDGAELAPEQLPVQRAAAGEDVRNFEERIEFDDGSTVVLIGNAVPLRDDAGKVRGAVAAFVDVTDRKLVEDALRASEARFRAVFENAGIGFLEIDEDWRIVAANNAYAQIAGRAAEALIGSDSLSFTHPDDLPRSKEAMRSLSEGRAQHASFEKRYIHPDGMPVWVRSNLTRVSTGPKGDRFLKIVENIGARKVAEEALREERFRLETLNKVWAAVAAELELEKVVQNVTDAGVDLTGADFGAFFYNVLNEAGESYMLYTLSGADRSAFEDFGMPRNTKVFGPTFAGEGTVRSDDITKDARYGKNPPHNGMPKGHLPVRSYLAVPVIGRSGEVIGGLFFGHPETGQFTDSHERLMAGIAAQAAIAIDNARLYQAVQRANETLEQRVEERTAELNTANEALRQAQKMEAIGQLTGGIAHDFNNMLTVIRGSADVLRRPDLEDERRERYLQAIADTSDRAARLTAQLLAFARRQTLKREVFDVAECVEGIAEMLGTLLGSRIRLTIDRGSEECLVETDAAQFETALVNIALNGRDAMDGEGALNIGVACAERLPPPHPQSDRVYVALSVSDSGHGIAAEDLDKIFEPFFTTKETGKGTGLGLSQVYGFAKQSGGEIFVDSEPGRGTTFTLYLPRAPEDRRPSDSREDRGTELPGSGRVLVVEDNDEVGQFAEQVLGELGFQARLVGSGEEALAILEEDSGFDVVFSDVVMAGIGGIDLANRIRSRWPDLPVVLTSGYSHVLAAGVDHSFPLLHKPYSLEGLAKVLGTALAGSNSTGPEEP